MQATQQQVEILSGSRSNRDLIVKARAGTGKGLREDQPVVTPKGMIPIGLLNEGDLVCGTDGNSYPVIGIYDRGILPLHKVTFNDGQSVITDSDHLWLCQTKSERDHKKGFFIRKTSDLILMKKKVFLPMPLPVEGTNKELPIDPWLLGALLGDGGMSDKSLVFTNHESNMIGAVQSKLPDGHSLKLISKITWRIVGNGYIGGQWRNNTLLNELRGLSLQGCGSAEKFIPEIYLTSTPESRLSVLRGLMDTDGHASKTHLEFSSASKKIVEGVRRIVESLGGLCSMSDHGSHYIKNGSRIECKQSYRLHIRIPSNIIPFQHCEHKKNAFVPKSKYPPVRQIVSIEDAGFGKSICIEVNSPDHLFLTVGHAVTHNTSVIEMVGRDQMHKNILLLCFNKDIRVAAEKRMPANVTCKTFHQLAWPTYGKYFEPQMKLRFYPKKIAQLIRCDERLVNVVRETVRKFTASNDRVITGFHVPYHSFLNKSKEEQNTFKEEVVSAARILWMHKTNVKNREVPVDFDDWLKMFELEGRVRGQFDMVIVDEGQDVTPRDLSIVNKIQSQKMIVGDDFQQLYEWRGSVNSLENVGIEDELFLTQSFRFGPAVADKANQVLALLNHKTPPLIGYKSIDSQISWDNEPTERHTVLCRTNAGLLSHAMDVIRKGKTIHVVGNMADMIRRLESAWYLSIGDLQKVTHPGVSLIGDWAALLELAHTDTEIKMLVQQVTKYNSSIPNICAELKAAGEYSEHSADIILSTVHKCVHPDTWVETPNGLMRIKDIPNHGMISTPFGVSSYEGKFTREESDTLILTTKRGYRIEVTHDHGMTVWRNSDHERVVASELKEGDLLRVQLGYHMDVVNYPSLPKHNGNIDPRTKIYSLPTVMTELLGEFLGLMVADGTVYKRGFKLTKRHLDVAERFKELVIELFDFDPKYFENLGTPGYDVNSVYLADWLKSLGGLCPNEKSIPDIILQSPMSVQSAFIRGLFEDGTVNMKDGVTDHIHFETKSETLARTVQTMLIRFGIISTVKHRISNDRPISTIYIYGGNIRIFADKIGFVSRFKNERLEDLPDCLKSNDYIPISVDELNAIRKYITIYDYQNAKSRSRISRCKVENLLNPSRNELEFLRDRMNWHYDPIVSIEKSRSVTMCITVNNGSRFIQNGFDGWNSKGLEWDIVRLAEDFPEELVVFKHRERTYEVKKSEVYCLYVAVTRAKQKLYVNSTISQLKHWKTLLGE